MVLVHGVFIVFAVAGGLLVARRPWLAVLHLPAVAWAALVELRGWICPLTPLENALRRAAGTASYETSFVEHYLAPLIYPAALTRELQIALGVAVLLVNVAAYAWVLRRHHAVTSAAR